MRYRSFERAASLALLRRPTQVLAVFDVDHFRAFRNLHGIAAGDGLLRTLLRRLDLAATALGGIVLRTSTDEFSLLIPAGTNDGDQPPWAEALMAAASQPFTHRGAHLAFSLSLGLAPLASRGNSPVESLRCARLAVTHGKQRGGGTIVSCAARALAEAQGRDALARDIPSAIADGEIVPFYQPVVALRTGQITGMEVLARWNHPVQGLLEPAAFIPLIEAQGMCSALTRALLRQVRQDSRAWPQVWSFAFNVSPNELRTLMGVIEGTYDTPVDMIDPRRIELEVTETALMRDPDLARRVVLGLQPHGIKIALDDFGTGYANFRQLRHIPFGRLKIDKSFITDMLEDPRAEACARAIIDLAHHLGMTAIAEGVETRAIAERLQVMECDHAQGYYYARPMPACEVAWVAPRRRTGKRVGAAA
jgi:predicted signal transduction protein with EAL and GGDEF domain